jgi:hypothetical protein
MIYPHLDAGLLKGYLEFFFILISLVTTKFNLWENEKRDQLKWINPAPVIL